MHRLVLLVVLAPQIADAFCASPSAVAPLVVTDKAVAADGGIVVITEGRAVENPPPRQRVRIDGKTSAPNAVALAPGLVLYRLPAGTKTAEVVEGKTVVAKVTVAAKVPAPLAAPRVKAIASRIDVGRKTQQRSEVTLADPVPAGAMALVVTDARDGHALTFGMPYAGASAVRVYYHFGCGTVPEGMAMPMMGDQVKLHWVDASGRVSPETPALTVGTLDRP